MRTSVIVSNFAGPGLAQGGLARIAEIADGSGIDSVFVADHLNQVEPGTDPADPMLEACTTLRLAGIHFSFIAGAPGSPGPS